MINKPFICNFLKGFKGRNKMFTDLFYTQKPQKGLRNNLKNKILSSLYQNTLDQQIKKKVQILNFLQPSQVRPTNLEESRSIIYFVRIMGVYRDIVQLQISSRR